MNWKLSFAPRRILNLVAALAGLGLLIVLAFSFNALFASRSRQSSPTTNQSQQPPFPPAIPNEQTESWETFSGSKYAEKYGDAYAFEIKYPPGWSLWENDYGTGFDAYFLSPDYKAPEKGVVEEVLEGARIELFVHREQKFSSLKEWHTSHYASYLNKGSYLGDVDIQVSPARSTTVAGKEAIEYEISGLGGEALGKAFNVGETVYQFRVVYKVGREDYIDILDQMISTFKTRR